ncbi:MAG: hypothetical protein J6K31_09190, partial [Parabacteroides sp.]|nr:hypothetical protein [Parabacteroides sp.]
NLLEVLDTDGINLLAHSLTFLRKYRIGKDTVFMDISYLHPYELSNLMRGRMRIEEDRTIRWGGVIV